MPNMLYHTNAFRMASEHLITTAGKKYHAGHNLSDSDDIKKENNLTVGIFCIRCLNKKNLQLELVPVKENQMKSK